MKREQMIKLIASTEMDYMLGSNENAVQDGDERVWDAIDMFGVITGEVLNTEKWSSYKTGYTFETKNLRFVGKEKIETIIVEIMIKKLVEEFYNTQDEYHMHELMKLKGLSL